VKSARNAEDCAFAEPSTRIRSASPHPLGEIGESQDFGVHILTDAAMAR
jgi:hypothetical protein